jgi:hypothetical protein
MSAENGRLSSDDGPMQRVRVNSSGLRQNLWVMGKSKEEFLGWMDSFFEERQGKRRIECPHIPTLFTAVVAGSRGPTV